MAALDMGASSEGKLRHDAKPKLAPKPPVSSLGQLTTRTPVQLLQSRSLSADAASKSGISETKEWSKEGEKLQLDTWDRGCIVSVNNNLNAGECDPRRNSPVNIYTPALTLRQGRRAKAPKPLPYLEPISCSRGSGGERQFAGRGSRIRRRKIAAFAPAAGSVKYRHSRRRRLSRTTNSVKRSPKPELAYLIVDLLSGTIPQSGELYCQPREESVRRGSRHLNFPTKLIGLSAMSEAKLKPKPLPRRKSKKAASPAESNPDSLGSYGRESVSPPVTVAQARKLTPDVDQQPASPTSCTQSSEHQCSDSASSSIQHHDQLRGSGEDSSLSLQGDSVHVPLPKRDSDPQPKPPEPYSSPRRSAPSPHSPHPVESDRPPPLPAKSELSRQIQCSIKKQKHLSEETLSPEPYESPQPLEDIDTHQNDSYGTDPLDENYIACDNSVPVDLTNDKPEELYIDPTLPLSSSGKPKPPRPPLPSASAIRKVRQRRAQSLAANRKHQISGSKSLTKKHSFPNSRTMNTGRFKTPTLPSSLPSTATVPRQQQCSVYEELDTDDSPITESSIAPWHPPPLPASNKSRKFSSETKAPTETAPALPPRTRETSSVKTRQRVKSAHSKPIPSEFSCSTSGGDLHSRAEMKKTVDREVQEPELEEDSVYEPVDISIPLPPHRTRRHIRGTHTCTKKNDNHHQMIHPKPATASLRRELHAKSIRDPVPRQSVPINPPQLDTLALNVTMTTFSPQLKAAKSTPFSSEAEKGKEKEDLKEKLSRMTLNDEGGTEEYMDMQWKEGWTEEEEKPDVYVDMHPVNGNRAEEKEEEDGPCMGPYASSDLLISRPDLWT